MIRIFLLLAVALALSACSQSMHYDRKSWSGYSSGLGYVIGQ